MLTMERSALSAELMQLQAMPSKSIAYHNDRGTTSPRKTMLTLRERQADKRD